MKKILKPCVYNQWNHYVIFGLQWNCVPLASWVSELLLSGKVKSLDVAEAKASLKWAYSHWG